MKIAVDGRQQSMPRSINLSDLENFAWRGAWQYLTTLAHHLGDMGHEIFIIIDSDRVYHGEQVTWVPNIPRDAGLLIAYRREWLEHAQFDIPVWGHLMAATEFSLSKPWIKRVVNYIEPGYEPLFTTDIPISYIPLFGFEPAAIPWDQRENRVVSCVTDEENIGLGDLGYVFDILSSEGVEVVATAPLELSDRPRYRDWFQPPLPHNQFVNLMQRSKWMVHGTDVAYKSLTVQEARYSGCSVVLPTQLHEGPDRNRPERIRAKEMVQRIRNMMDNTALGTRESEANMAYYDLSSSKAQLEALLMEDFPT